MGASGPCLREPWARWLLALVVRNRTPGAARTGRPRGGRPWAAASRGPSGLGDAPAGRRLRRRGLLLVPAIRPAGDHPAPGPGRSCFRAGVEPRCRALVLAAAPVDQGGGLRGP